jgi:hypothetical protein
VKKHSVRIRIVKPYKSKNVNFAPDEIVWVSQKLADELILADAAATRMKKSTARSNALLARIREQSLT